MKLDFTICFSNLFKYFPHRHLCLRVLLRLSRPTAFAMLHSKPTIVKNQIQKPITVKMGLSTTIVNGLKLLTIKVKSVSS